MWYVFICEDNPNSLALRKQTRGAHLERLQTLDDEKRLLVAGPCPATDSMEPGDVGFTGSIVIADFLSLDEAQAWADDEPYLAAGVYQSVTVKPFKKVLPA